MNDQERIEQVLAAQHPCVTIVTPEERHAMELIRHAAMGVKLPIWVWSAVRGVHAGLFEDSESLKDTEHPAAALYHYASRLVEPAICVMLDLAAHLDDARTLRALRETIEAFHGDPSVLILVEHDDTLPLVISQCSMCLELSPPDEQELEKIIKATLQRAHRHKKIEVSLGRRDLRTIIRNLRGLTRRQAEQIIMDAVAVDRKLSTEDINTILAHKRQHLYQAGALEYVEAPVDLESIGGLRRLKRWLEQRQDALSDEATEFGLAAPRGVLLLGVQGAGKSLSAKAIATAWQRPLLRLDPGALFDRYVGESERRLRDALHQAEMMAPVILWIDEIEKGFASAASQSTDGGLSRRMFGTLLTWMQDHREPVFMVATANDIAALPPELLRKGRFDEIFFVDLPERDVRRQILAIHLRLRDRDPERFDLANLAELSDGFSGAELEQAVVSALHTAYADRRELTNDDLTEAIRTSPPLAVTMAERIAELRHWASGRCVPAD